MAWCRIEHKPLSEPILTQLTTELKTEHKQNKTADKFTFQIFTGSTYYVNTLTLRPGIPFPWHSNVNGWQESGTIHNPTFLPKTKSRTSQMFLYTIGIGGLLF